MTWEREMDDLRIIWIDVFNFRSIRTRHFFDLRTPCGDAGSRMIVDGPNGVGKTSFLEAILFGLGRDDLLKHLPPPRNTFPEGARVVACVQVVGRYYRVERTAGDAPTWATLENPMGAAIGLVTNTPNPRVRYVPPLISPRPSGPAWPSRDELIWHPYENPIHKLKQTIVSQRIYGPSPNAKLRTLNDIWSMLHDDGSSIIDEPIVPEDPSAGFDLYVVEKDGSRRCSVDQLGGGEMEALCQADALPRHNFNGVLLVDGPGSRFHPQWQGRIWQILHRATPLAQIIIVSNADDLWDQAYSYERYLMAPLGDPRRSDFDPPPSLR